MQRANSNGIPFLRRQSTNAPPPVPYANPAATQFLRLGVGIDHVDVEHSDDEDVIYQGIENGMDGHDDDDEVGTDGEEDEEDEDLFEEDIQVEDVVLIQHDGQAVSVVQGNNNTGEEDINVVRQGQRTHDDSIRTLDNNNIITNEDKGKCRSSQGHQQQLESLVAQGNVMPSSQSTFIPTALNASSGTGTIASSINEAATSEVSTGLSSITASSSSTRAPPATASTTTTPSSSLSSPAGPRRVPTSINTQPTKKTPLSADPQLASPTSPLAQGLPVYHEKFTKATSNKIHGASPLSNANNTTIASTATVTAGAVATVASTSPTKPSAPRRTATTATTGANRWTESSFAAGENASTTVAPIRRFAEKDGFTTIHNCKIHYKITYPTLDPSYRVNGNGRNIILFHGAVSHLDTWRKVQQSLADRTGCRVLSYDRVGHGLSDKPSRWPKNANPYKNGGVLAICESLLETLGMHQNLILIGNGTGATIASAIALSKPQLVRGLILIAPSILDEAPPLYLRACVSYPPPLSWIYRALYGDHGPLQQFYYKPKAMMSDPSTLEMYMSPLKEEGFWRGLSNATKYRASYKIDQHLERLTEFSTLVMTGDVDDVVPTMATLRLFEVLQSARQLNVPQVLKIIKHSGHLPQEEKPNDFLKVASFFIRKVCLGSLARERSFNRRASGGVVRTMSKRSTKDGQHQQPLHHESPAPTRGERISNTGPPSLPVADTHVNVQSSAVSPAPALDPKSGLGAASISSGQGPNASPQAQTAARLENRGPPTITSKQAAMPLLPQAQPIASY
ncbi:hypothetical protein EDD11_010181 [Mortierella claussenii]|nr:hypothetical protein EDD11_010181 [Mortierella claussenii]